MWNFKLLVISLYFAHAYKATESGNTVKPKFALFFDYLYKNMPAHQISHFKMSR